MKKTIFCALAIWPVITFGAGPDIAVPNTPANGDVAEPLYKALLSRQFCNFCLATLCKCPDFS